MGDGIRNEGMHIMIKETNGPEPTGNTTQPKVINYETFESSSEDEFSQGAFESACQSFVNKEKHPDQNISDVHEQKRVERQRRKERKAGEKQKVKLE